MSDRSFDLLISQHTDLKDSIKLLHEKTDKLLNICHETSIKIEVLQEVKKTLQRDIEHLMKQQEILRQDRVEQKSFVKAIFTTKNFLIAVITAVIVVVGHEPAKASMGAVSPPIIESANK